MFLLGTTHRQKSSFPGSQYGLTKQTKFRHLLFLAVHLTLVTLFSFPTDTFSAENIKVASFSFAPLISTDETGFTEGLNVDILEKVAEDNDLQITYRFGSWQDGLDRARKNEVDLLTSVMYTKERDEYLDYSQVPIFTVMGVAYALPKSGINSILDLKHRTIAVMEGDANGLNFQELAQSFDLDCQYIEVPSHQLVFQFVEQGNAFAGVAPNIFGLLQAPKYNLVQTPVIFSPKPLYFATPQGKNPELLETIDHTLAHAKKDLSSFYYRSLDKWLVAKGLRHDALPTWFLPSLIVFSSLILFLFLWGFILKKQVRSRTRELSEQEQRATALYDHSPDMYVSVSPEDASILHCNETLAKKLGYNKSEIIGRGVFDLYHSDCRIDAKKTFKQFQKTGEVKDKHLTLKKKDGSPLDVSLNVSSIRDSSGKILYSISSWRDISERIKAEERLELIIKGSQDAPWDWALDSNELYYSPQWWQQLGYESNALPADASLWERLMHPDDAEHVKAVFSGALDSGADSYDIEFRLQHKEGHYVPILSRGFITRNKKGEPIRVTGTNMDLTDRKNAEAALYEANAILQTAMDQSPAGIAIADAPDGRLRYVNDAGLLIRGGNRETIVNGVGIDQYVASWKLLDLDGTPLETEEVPLAHALIYGEACSREFIIRRAEGDDRIVSANAAPVRDETGQVNSAIVIFTDITEKKQAEEEKTQLENQLHQSRKIESLGRLAGGVAHDYNNMLSVIIGNLELVKMKVDPSAPVHHNLDQILNAANRSRDITQQLLAFARKQIISPAVIDVNTAMEKMLKMLHNLLGENIDLVWHPKENIWPVRIDPSQLDQVLINLCINARDAIIDTGKMTIEIENILLDEDYCESHTGFVPGSYVMLAVSDNGCGMDSETLEKVFEPFFSTKKDGEGTGLGMATVYGIVKQSQGFINAYSEPGQGTTFKIYLPRCDEEPEMEQQTVPSEVQQGNGETILLTEDEVSIITLVSSMLGDLNYKVLTASCPVEALSLAEAHQGTIDLLITDVVMPEMNGRELATKIQGLHPEINCLFMSGYTANVIAHHGVLDEGINFIHKPFSRIDLSVMVRKALDSNKQDEA